MRFICILLLSIFIGNPVSGIELKVLSLKVSYKSNDTLQTWNYRKDGIINLIKSNPLDIFCIQQVLIDHINDIASKIPGFDWVGVGCEDGVSQGEYAPIFYDARKYQLKEHGTFWLSKNSGKPGIEGICTYACFEDYETRENFQIFNTNFEHLDLREEDAARLIMNMINELSGRKIAVLLTGDFSSVEKNFPIRYLRRKLDYENKENFERTDVNYIFVNKHLHIVKQEIVDIPSAVYPEKYWPVYVETLYLKK